MPPPAGPARMPPRLLVVDIVAQVVSMVPAPYLQPAVATFRIILSHIDQVQTNKRQIRAISETVAQILFYLNSSETWIEDKWMVKIRGEFEELLSRIANFCAKNTRKKAFRSFLEAAEVQAEINTIHTQLSLSVDSFQISSQISTQHLQQRLEAARQEDQAEINATLKKLHKTQDTLLELVGQPTPGPSSPNVDSNDIERVGSKNTIIGLLSDIQDTVNSPVNIKSQNGVLGEVFVELRKRAILPSHPHLADPNPIVANLKPGLTANVLIAPLRWQMHNYMRKDQITQHLYPEDIKQFARDGEGSKLFVNHLMTTDDISLQYSALEVFRKDRIVKHFFKPE